MELLELILVTELPSEELPIDWLDGILTLAGYDGSLPSRVVRFA